MMNKHKDKVYDIKKFIRIYFGEWDHCKFIKTRKLDSIYIHQLVLNDSDGLYYYTHSNIFYNHVIKFKSHLLNNNIEIYNHPYIRFLLLLIFSNDLIDHKEINGIYSDIEKIINFVYEIKINGLSNKYEIMNEIKKTEVNDLLTILLDLVNVVRTPNKKKSCVNLIYGN